MSAITATTNVEPRTTSRLWSGRVLGAVIGLACLPIGLLWGGRARLGVWVTIWGAVAMATSAPFDDWWHNTYGLDVKIVSPPHAILGLGMFAVGMGVLLFVFSAQNRAGAEAANGLGLLCAVAA